MKWSSKICIGALAGKYFNKPTKGHPLGKAQINCRLSGNGIQHRNKRRKQQLTNS